MTESVYPDNNRLSNLEVPAASPLNGKNEDMKVSCLNVTSGTYQAQKLDSGASREHKEAKRKTVSSTMGEINAKLTNTSVQI